MSIEKKNGLLIFRNKKINSFAEAEKIADEFSSDGYYFEKLEFIAYDSPADIVRSVKSCKANYENTVILCPHVMKRTLTEFVEQLYAAQFDEFGVLTSENAQVFMLFSDAANKLKVKNIVNILNKKYSLKFNRAFIKTAGASAEKINAAISDANTICRDIDYAVSEHFGDCCIRLVYGKETPKSDFDEAYRTILKNLNDYVYAIEDIALSERLVQLLKLRRMKISVAESFTGGGVCKKLVEVPGVSEVFFEGLNTYSNEAKMQRLGVKEDTLKMYGAVSEQTAYEMAEGLIATGNCDVCIATTGIAGPKSDNTKKPVGLNYIAIGTPEGITVYKFNLSGNREKITKTAINLALYLAYKSIK